MWTHSCNLYTPNHDRGAGKITVYVENTFSYVSYWLECVLPLYFKNWSIIIIVMVGYLKDMQRLCHSALKDFFFFFFNNTKSMFQVLVHVHVVPYDHTWYRLNIHRLWKKSREISSTTDLYIANSYIASDDSHLYACFLGHERKNFAYQTQGHKDLWCCQ